MELGIAQIIGLVIIVILAIVGSIFICLKSKKHDLIKWVTLFILLAVGLTWVFIYGYYSGVTFVEDYGMNQQGLSDIPNLLYYAFNIAGDKIIFLLSLGVFYGVLVKCKGYRKLVDSCAKIIKGRETSVVIAVSLIFTVLTTFFTQNFIPLIFAPFIISILLSAKMDKITAFCATFGSMLIGILGQTYGGDGLYWFNRYVGLSIDTALLYRLLILVIAFILFNFFTILHLKKTLNGKHSNEEAVDPYQVQKLSKEEEKTRVWPIITLFALIMVICILGYIDWKTNFGFTGFEEFHNKVMNYTLNKIPLIGGIFGEDLGKMAFMKVALGSLFSDANFGAWNLFHASVVLVLASLLVALISRVKLDDYISGAGEGIKKISLPLGLFIGIYMIMMAAYMSPFVPTITNLMFKGISKFNPYLVSLSALIANTFHADLGFTGYAIGNFVIATYGANANVIHTIFVSMYGLVQLALPTSGLLLIGLSYLQIEYKEWIKYSWLFLVGILIILLVIFTIMTYI